MKKTIIRWSAHTRKLLRRALALVLAVLVVTGFGLTWSADRVLRATEMPEDPAETEAVAAVDQQEEDLAREEKEVTLPSNDGGGDSSAAVEISEPESSSDDGTGEAGGQTAGGREESPATEPLDPENAELSDAGETPEELPPAEEDPAEKQAGFPAQTLRGQASDGARVTVNAPEGALPEGCSVSIRVVSAPEAEAAAVSAAGEDRELVGVTVYDITLHDKDGQEIQPKRSVQISVAGASSAAGDHRELYHVEGGSASKVGNLSDAGSATFSASHFSYYVSITTNSTGEEAGAEAKEPTIRISPESATLTKAGDSVRFEVSLTDAEGEVTWRSADNRVAEVNKGLVTAVGAGQTTVTATVPLPDGGTLSAEAYINVVISVRDSGKWSTGDAEMNWSISDDGVLSVSGSGELRAENNKNGFGYDGSLKSGDTPWKQYAGSIQEIVIGEGVTSVGERAFQGCSNLKRVSFSEGSRLRSVGGLAFYGCNDLVEIDMSHCKELTSLESYAGDPYMGAFSNQGNRTLVKVTLPVENLKVIGNGAFRDRRYLDVNLSECTSLETIGDYAFEDKHTANTIDFSGIKTLKSIGMNALMNNTGIVTVDLSGNRDLETIGKEAFCTRSGFPSSITSVDLSGCSSLRSIGEGAFSIYGTKYPPTLTSVDLSGCTSLTEIRKHTFRGQKALNSISIPENIVSIADGAFQDCGNLRNLEWNAANYTDNLKGKLNRSVTSLTIGSAVEYLPDDFFDAMSSSAVVSFAGGSEREVSMVWPAVSRERRTYTIDEKGRVYLNGSLVYPEPEEPFWKTAPSGKILTYTGVPQELVDPGEEGEDSKTQYQMEGDTDWKDARDAEGNNLVTALNAGVYNIYFRIISTVNDNVVELPDPVTVTIGQAKNPAEVDVTSRIVGRGVEIDFSDLDILRNVPEGTTVRYAFGKDMRDKWLKEKYGSAPSLATKNCKLTEDGIYTSGTTDGVDEIMIILTDTTGNYSETMYKIPIYVSQMVTLHFDANGGSAARPAVMTARAGNTLGALPVTSRAGYSFDGWYTAPEGGEPVTAGTKAPYNNVTCYAHWTPNTYRITFDSNGGSSVSPIRQTFGTAVTAPSSPTRKGYVFEGWEPAVPETMPDHDLTVRARWSRVQMNYSVRYYLNGTNEQIAPAVIGTAAYGDSVTGEARAIEGYTPVSSNATLEKTVERDGEVLRFDYYRNVTLTASGDTVPYDGSPHEVSGYAADHDATFSGLTVRAGGTDAGTYRAAFPEGTVGKVDDSGTCIVTAAEDGELVIEPLTVTVTPAASGKAYGKEDPELTATVSGAVSGEENRIRYSLAREGGEEVGIYPITASGEEEQGNYIVQFGTAEFTIVKSDELGLAVTGFDGLYDGTEHAVTAVPTVTDGVRITYSTDGGKTWKDQAPSITDAGEIPVLVRAEHAGYKTATAETVLKVAPRPVTVTAENRSKVYGSADPALTAKVTGLVGKDTAEYTLTRAEGEDAGEYEITVSAKEDQGNYTVSSTPAVFTIERADLPLAAYSAARKYDGTALAAAPSAELPDGVKVSYSADGGETWTEEAPEIRDAGQLAYRLRAEGGNYNTAYADGAITIIPRAVTLTSDSASGEYDGNALTADHVAVGGDGFAEGEGASCEVTGSQTVVGTSGNHFRYTLNEGTDERNYAITVLEGKLEVTNRDAKYEIGLVVNSGEYLYDGESKSVADFRNTRFTVDGNNYEVQGMSASLTATHAGTYAVHAEGMPLVVDEDGNDVTDQFRVTTESGTLTIRPRTVRLSSASACREYNGAPLGSAEVTVSGEGFADGEGASYNVTGRQKTVGSSENTFTYRLHAGTEAGDYEIAQSYGVLTVLSRSEGAKYEIVVAGASDEALYDGREHTASGILNPATGEKAENGSSLTYTVGGNTYTLRGLSASASGTGAGNYAVSVTGIPSVLDADGNDVSSEFVLREKAGTLTVRRRNVTLTSASVTHAYTGRPITDDSVEIGGDGFASGEGATCRVTGSQTLVGISENSFTYTLDAGTDAANYSITRIPGTLNVTNRDARYRLTLTPSGAEYLYDGGRKSVDGFVSTTAEIDGLRFDVSGLTAHAEGTDAGTYPAAVSGTPVVRDENGNDVSDQFSVTFEPGVLRIRPRTVILRSADLSREYDGSPLMGAEVEVLGDGFADGEGVFFTPVASRTLVGVTENEFRWAFDEGTDPSNYIVQTVFGWISVTNREAAYQITLRANSATVEYDGEEHRVEGFESLEFEVEGKTYTTAGVETGAAGTEAGIYPTAVTGEARVFDADEQDVTDQFAVGYESGMLTITAAPEARAEGGPGTGSAEIAEEVPSGGEEAAQGSTATIGSNTVPYASAAPGYWALVNLFLLILTILAAALSFLARGRKESSKEEGAGESEAAAKTGESGRTRRGGRALLPGILPVIGAVLSILLFFLTEDLTNTMAIVDRYTIGMLILFLAAAVPSFIGKKAENEENRSA